MNKNVIIAIVVVVIATGIYIFMSNSNSQGATEEVTIPTPATTGATQTEEITTSQTATVQYTDSGYSPSTLEVPLGTAVTFVNQSSKQMWTASNPHPVHTEYRQFDAKSGVKTGESYSFTFDRSGEWGYHNHLVPGDTGTIIVKQ